MNKKIIVFLTIILSLAASVSFAAVLSEYGTITGTANNVLPPTFYIGSVDNETLSINEKPSNCNTFGIANTYRTFETKDLEGVNFNYLPEINFQVWVKGTTTSTSPVKLGLAFGYYNGDGEDDPQYLATTTTFDLNTTMHNYSLQGITASKIPSNVHHFFYEFTKICPPDDPSCSVSIGKCDGNGFYTKVRLSK